MEEVNDRTKWAAFVKKLISQTIKNKFKWNDFKDKTSRNDSLGSIFFAEIINGKYVVVYRYEYRYYRDEDSYETRQDVAIELVNSVGNKLWRLPDVGAFGHELIDLIQFYEADAQNTFDDFLSDDA